MDNATLQLRTGDAGQGGWQGFVQLSVELWDQWAKVVHLMNERDPKKVRESNGFALFGKECRDVCFRFKAMFHWTQTKAYYLHTIIVHAGTSCGRMEIRACAMCLGMMSNSGAEQRHEYGRRRAVRGAHF